MSITVEEFIAKREAQLKAEKQKWKDEKLQEWGLTEKEYSPDGRATEKYQLIEEKDGKTLYYRNVPISMSDEEFAEIEKSVKKKGFYKRKKDLDSAKKYFNIFKALPLVLFWMTMGLSFILGIIFAENEVDGGFIACLLVGAIFGGINYFLTKIIVAPTVLTVEYLSLLTQDMDVE